MAIRYSYTYKKYEGVPAATSASRGYSSAVGPLGLGIIVISLMIGVVLDFAIDNSLVSFLCALLIAAVSIGILFRGHDPHVIREMINSLDYSKEEKKILIRGLSKGWLFGGSSVDGAYHFAFQNLTLTNKYKSGVVSTEQYNKQRRGMTVLLPKKGLVSLSTLFDPTVHRSVFYFENDEEQSIYLRITEDTLDFHWEASSRRYQDTLQVADECFEKNQFDTALTVYESCISINPIAIKARYGASKCLIRQGRIEEGKAELLKMKWYFTKKGDIARYYRELGYALKEAKEYESAYASA